MSDLSEQLPDLREQLADYAHDSWSRWMRHMFDNWTSDNMERWKRQMYMPYSELPEPVKESDRKEADRIMEIVDKELKLDQEELDELRDRIGC